MDLSLFFKLPVNETKNLTLSSYSILCCSIDAHLSAGDSVSIREYDKCPSFVGKIMRVRTADEVKQSSFLSCYKYHPFGQRESYETDGLFLIQFYQVKNSDETWEQWPSPSYDVFKATVGLVEAAPTNLVIWCSPDQVEELVFFPHCRDCVDQCYGPLHGRTNCFYVFAQIYVLDDDEMVIEVLPPNQYHMFGAGDYNHHIYTPCIYSQRINEALHYVTRTSTKLLTKMGKLSSSELVKIPLTTEAWSYIR